jgi:hypothetical protein
VGAFTRGNLRRPRGLSRGVDATAKPSGLEGARNAHRPGNVFGRGRRWLIVTT